MLRFPAEWDAQSGVLIAWPHAGTDWAERLDAVEATYVALVQAITRFEPVLVCAADPAIEARARALLSVEGCDPARLHFEVLPYDDTWLRDSGPITLREGDNFRLLDFHFTAWGGKFESALDDQIVATLAERGRFRQAQRERIDFALEGGAIETDGAGTLLSTWRCLHERHPDMPRADVTARLQAWLHQDRTLWLEHGYLEGDDTDAHIDTLARFAGVDAIVYQGCQDPADAHHAELQAMAAELAAFRRADGSPYRLFELPWPQPILDAGRRLAASYANFLIVNGAVLMPAYGDAMDEAAAAVLASAFPGREIVAVNCRPLIWQNGSLHCLTMQLPEGLLA
jgi:agmatine/peptidylarginine deiminase